MKKIIIDGLSSPRRTALLDNGKLIEFFCEENNNSPVANNIYIGTIKKILPSLFAFIDIGSDKNAFLCLGDKKENHLWHFDEVKNKKTLLIKEGQQIAVQVEKEETDIKGAYLTTALSYSGKYIVLMKNDESIGISKKIEDINIRKKLKKDIKTLLPKGYGAIIRTECENISFDELKSEVNELLKISTDTLKKAEYTKAPAIIYKAISPFQKAIRDFFDSSEDEVVSNDKNILSEILFENKIYYEDNLPLFDRYSINPQLQKALHNKIWLNCGGFLIFDYAEACTVIDVNTGKYTSKGHKETILKTNLEAVDEIAYQIRLKNLSGMIIIDFIDMPFPEDRKIILDALSKKIKNDSVSVNLVSMTELGLVQLTRKKARKPLHQLLMQECPFCSGTGYIENEIYIANKIREKICSLFATTIFKEVTLCANQYVIDAFKGKNNDYKEIEKKYNKKINFRTIKTQKYDYFSIEK